MNDAAFRSLPHCVAAPLQIASRGSLVARGYRPDATIEHPRHGLRYILESEQKSDRKAFLGDMIKAERHAELRSAAPKLVIVMAEFPNTTVRQIAAHLGDYAGWFRKSGHRHLSGILVISDAAYLASIRAAEPLCSPAFNRRAIAI